MWQCKVDYHISSKELIRSSLSRMKKEVFVSWLSPPRFRILPSVYEKNKFFSLMITYNMQENEKISGDECLWGHIALDMAQSFISGVLYQARRNKRAIRSSLKK